jgi:hypothetical protein
MTGVPHESHGVIQADLEAGATGTAASVGAQPFVLIRCSRRARMCKGVAPGNYMANPQRAIQIEKRALFYHAPGVVFDVGMPDRHSGGARTANHDIALGAPANAHRATAKLVAALRQTQSRDQRSFGS